jgi:hypothetical protein
VLRICPSPRLCGVAGTIDAADVRDVNAAPIGCVPLHEFSTTWETPSAAGPVILRLLIPNIAVPIATAISMPTWMTLPCPRATTLTMWSPPQCGWWWKTDCRTDRHHGIYGVTIGFLFLGPRFRTGSRRRGKKNATEITGEYLDRALADFSGYIAADELYDGPFCVLFIVDNHRFKRLYYDVLDHDPTHKDMIRFFKRFQHILHTHGLTLKGVTTDGSPLYPEPLANVFGNIKHQLCQFHILKEITKAILKAVTQVRKQLKAQQIPCSRGRPAGAKVKQIARKNQRLQQKIADLFEYRYLFVKHTLTPKEKRIFGRITRGLPPLRTLRTIMNEVYRLFDRRCRMDTALKKLARLRRRVSRFKTLGKTLKKLFSPNLEKALTFLDDSLLPSTSNAVERANRRHRKMQKSIYRVRTREHISQRIAVDMQRDVHIDTQRQTTSTLHRSRSNKSHKTYAKRKIA